MNTYFSLYIFGVQGKHKLNRSKLAGQKGIYFVLAAFFLFALFAIGALVIGTGFIILDNIKLQNLANIAAQAALDGYNLKYNKKFSDPENTAQAGERAAYALELAKQSFMKNKLYSGAAKIAEKLVIGGVGYGTKLEFGKYLQSDDGSGNFLCTGFPCFLQVDPYSNAANVNAVRIHIRTDSTDNLIAPFAGAVGFLKDGLFTVDVSATAVLIPKCMSLMVDVSDLSYRDSHNYSIGTDSLTTYDSALGNITYPDQPGMFSYPAGITCPAAAAVSGQSTVQNYWCNLQRTASKGSSAVKHAATDYKNIITRAGDFFVDHANLPQPLSGYLNGLNAYLQAYSRVAGVSDKVVLFAFADMQSPLTRRGFVDRIPGYGTGANSYPGDTNIGFLSQILNTANIGSIDPAGNFIPGREPVHPNFIDRGWFPDISVARPRQKSNLALAISSAADEMNQFCPAGSLKNIIVASHGVTQGSYSVNADGSYNPSEINQYTDFSNEVGNVIFGDGPSPLAESLTAKLKRWKIKVSTLHSGFRTQPNFCARIDSRFPGSSRFLKIQDMFLAGYKPLSNKDCTTAESFSNTSNSINQILVDKCGSDLNNCAYKHLGDVSINSINPADNTFFRTAGYLLSRLALENQGAYCPLLPKAPDSLYSNTGIPVEERPFTPLQLISGSPPYSMVAGQQQNWRIDNLSDGGAVVSCLGGLLAAERTYLLD